MDEIERLLAEWRNEAADHDNVHTVLADTLERCADELQAAMADLSPGWQPIETAPKDGTLFLAWGPERNQEDPAVVRAKMIPSRDGPFIECTRPNAADDGCLYLTHWMPIPRAPE